jgi:hypothetical protein
MHWLTLADVMADWQHGSGTTRAYWGMILPATIFLASPRMDLCLCLCSQLLRLGLEVYFSNRIVTASYETISVHYE